MSEENSHLYIIYVWGTPIILCESGENLREVLDEIRLYVIEQLEEEDFRLEILKYPTISESGIVELFYTEDELEDTRKFYVDLFVGKYRFY